MLMRELVSLIFVDATNALGMYVYLMAVNGLTLYQSLSLTPRSRVLPVLKTELLHVAFFTLTMIIVSFVREYLGSGAIFGIPVPMPYKLSGLAMPFSGFILLGFTKRLSSL